MMTRITQPIRATALCIMAACSFVAANLHIDITGGYSVHSAYRYVDEAMVADTLSRLMFKGINNVCASSRLAIDIGSTAYRLGVYGGFIRRYDLYTHRRYEEQSDSVVIGDMLSIPLLVFIEFRRGQFFYEFGLGPSITRINYANNPSHPFSVTSFFGYLFGAGYEIPLAPQLAVQIKGELLMHAPTVVIDAIDPAIRETVHASRFTEYNSKDYPAIIYNAALSIGIRYDFGSRMNIPLPPFLKKRDDASPVNRPHEAFEQAGQIKRPATGNSRLRRHQ
jgi:hypothetical protein